MADETMRLGARGLGRLAQQVTQEWQEGPGAAAERLETCEDCGGLLGFVDPKEREMADQWESWEPPPVGPGGRGTGWVWGAEGTRSGRLGGLTTGWMAVRDEDL